jgi:hypothetical protein
MQAAPREGAVATIMFRQDAPGPLTGFPLPARFNAGQSFPHTICLNKRTPLAQESSNCYAASHQSAIKLVTLMFQKLFEGVETSGWMSCRHNIHAGQFIKIDHVGFSPKLKYPN